MAKSSQRNVPRRTWLRKLGRIAFIGLAPYLFVVALAAVFQRSLIYHPSREPNITPQDAGLENGRVHAIRLSTHDGLTLNGWHILARGRHADDLEACDRELSEGRPVVIYFSGNAANRRYRASEFTLLTNAGADVFLFDYRGYGDNPGSPSEADLAADAQAIWHYVTQDRDVSPERVFLYGESLGGAVAVRLAAEICQAGTEPGGILLRSTFSSLVDTAATHYPWLPVHWTMLDRYPSEDRIHSVSCPILHLHGTEDRVVPIELGRQLIAAAPDHSTSGVAKRFVTIQSAGHNDITEVARPELSDAIGAFLAR